MGTGGSRYPVQELMQETEMAAVTVDRHSNCHEIHPDSLCAS